jgi:hypothetical protein
MPLAATDKVDLLFRAFSDRTRVRILFFAFASGGNLRL